MMIVACQLCRDHALRRVISVWLSWYAVNRGERGLGTVGVGVDVIQSWRGTRLTIARHVPSACRAAAIVEPVGAVIFFLRRDSLRRADVF